MIKSFFAALAVGQDYALMALRVFLSVIMLRHGYGKIFGGSFGVPFFDKVGIPWPSLLGPFVSFLEFFGGLCLLVGLFTRYLGVLFCIQFMVAGWALWFGLGSGGSFGKAEYPLLIVFSSAVLAAYGSGAWAVDRVYKRLEP